MTKIMQTQKTYILKSRLFPIIKWAGGKEQELKYIHPAIPKRFQNYYEPFVGGGATFFSIEATKMYINDKSYELINLYNAIRQQDDVFFDTVNNMMSTWDFLEVLIQRNANEIIKIYNEFSNNNKNDVYIKEWIDNFMKLKIIEIKNILAINLNFEIFIKEIKKNLFSKIKRMKKIELEKGKLPSTDILDNFEAAIKSALYMYYRYLHNNIIKYQIKVSQESAIFFFIRNYAYSGMFRYNKSGDFNVPYGGIGYNRKNLRKKLDYLQSDKLNRHLNNTVIENLDFEKFFDKYKPSKDDFIFLDPPYDTEFSTYAQNEFTKSDQKRLANYLINKCEANWMMIIKNTDFIYELYNKEGIHISSFDKKYLVSFQNRNDKDVEHLLIKNYEE